MVIKYHQKLNCDEITENEAYLLEKLEKIRKLNRLCFQYDDVFNKSFKYQKDYSTIVNNIKE